MKGSMTCSCQNPSRAWILSLQWHSLCVVDHGIKTSVYFPALFFISVDRMMVTIFISSGLSKSICSWSSFDPGRPTVILQTPASPSPLTIIFQVINFPGDIYHLVSYHHLDSGSFQASSPSLLNQRSRVLTTDRGCSRADRLALSPRALAASLSSPPCCRCLPPAHDSSKKLATLDSS